MTATELHALMEPCREAMVKDGIWPTRDVRWKLALCLEVWLWRNEVSPATALQCHHDDAHNAFLAALLGWALNQAESNCLIGIDTIPGHINVPWSKHPTPLHALVSAYRKAQGIK